MRCELDELFGELGRTLSAVSQSELPISLFLRTDVGVGRELGEVTRVETRICQHEAVHQTVKTVSLVRPYIPCLQTNASL